MMTSLTASERMPIFLKKALVALGEAIIVMISLASRTKLPFVMKASSPRSAVQNSTSVLRLAAASFTDIPARGEDSGSLNFISSTFPPAKVSILSAEGKRNILAISSAAASSGLMTIARPSSFFI